MKAIAAFVLAGAAIGAVAISRARAPSSWVTQMAPRTPTPTSNQITPWPGFFIGTTNVTLGGVVDVYPPPGSSAFVARLALDRASPLASALQLAPVAAPWGGVEFVGSAPGLATVTCSWTDAGGQVQTAEFAVRVE